MVEQIDLFAPKVRPLNVLVACEESQAVCKEMRRLGHRAFSCDLQDCSGGHPEWHVKGDVLALLNGNCDFHTADSRAHTQRGSWDLIIAHPPCTYLTNVATRWYSLRVQPAEKVVARWRKRAEAAVLFMRFIGADCPRIAVENPVGFMGAAYRRADQIVQPWWWAESEDDAENYYSKATGLWLKGLPLLVGNGVFTHYDYGQLGKYSNGKNKTWEDTHKNSKFRSKTPPGLARAMAEQWAGDARKEKDNG